MLHTIQPSPVEHSGDRNGSRQGHCNPADEWAGVTHRMLHVRGSSRVPRVLWMASSSRAILSDRALRTEWFSHTCRDARPRQPANAVATARKMFDGETANTGLAARLAAT